MAQRVWIYLWLGLGLMVGGVIGIHLTLRGHSSTEMKQDGGYWESADKRSMVIVTLFSPIAACGYVVVGQMIKQVEVCQRV